MHHFQWAWLPRSYLRGDRTSHADKDAAITPVEFKQITSLFPYILYARCFHEIRYRSPLVKYCLSLPFPKVSISVNQICHQPIDLLKTINLSSYKIPNLRFFIFCETAGWKKYDYNGIFSTFNYMLFWAYQFRFPGKHPIYWEIGCVFYFSKRISEKPGRILIFIYTDNTRWDLDIAYVKMRNCSRKDGSLTGTTKVIIRMRWI